MNKNIVSKSKKYSLFTWMPQKTAQPVIIKDEDGCYFFDDEGNRFFDLSSSQVYVNSGYNNPMVVEQMKQQLETVPIANSHNTTEIRARVAEKIIKDVAPDNMAKVLFTLGGADANEYAIRIAKSYTGRTKIMSQYGSYHGSTYGASNLTGEVSRSSLEPLIPGFVHFLGYNWRNPGVDFKDEDEKADFLADILHEQIKYEDPKTIAAIFFETITGSNGVYVPSKRYYENVRKLCDEYGILMVCDEVMVGFCRTGKWFACQNYDIKPDLITFAKGSTSGYAPMGGVIISKAIAGYFDEAALPCGLTYNSHPVSLAACWGNLYFYEKEGILDNCTKMGKKLKSGLESLKEKHLGIEEVRGMGLMLALQFTKEFCNNEYEKQFLEGLAQRKYITFGSEGMTLITPPLIIDSKEVDGIVQAVDDTLSQMNI